MHSRGVTPIPGICHWAQLERGRGIGVNWTVYRRGELFVSMFSCTVLLPFLTRPVSGPQKLWFIWCGHTSYESAAIFSVHVTAGR